MSKIHCRIITPRGVYKEFYTSIVNVDTVDGRRGILPNHMPLVTVLKIGKLSTEEESGRQEYAVAGGVLYFRDNLAEILTDAIENKDEIDYERAEQARQRAQRRLESNDLNVDLKRAQIALQKALNRINMR